MFYVGYSYELQVQITFINRIYIAKHLKTECLNDAIKINILDIF